MNLINYKSRNIYKTWLFFAGFLVFVIFIGWFFAGIYANPSILYFAIIFSVLINIIAYWFSDKIVLKMARAAPIEKKDNPEFYNIVENLCIVAGLPMPKIYLIKEKQLNAFATGRNQKHAAVAVTEGLLEKLDKRELEGVISHELSHINNRDMLLSTAIVVLAGFISIISNWFLRSRLMGFGSQSGKREGNQIQGILMIIGIVLAILAPIAALLIRLAISRKREFLADASGALLTHYPEGLASALVKISSDSAPMAIANNTTAHLWLDDPFKEKNKTHWLHRLFMTHPLVEDRIKTLRGMKI